MNFLLQLFGDAIETKGTCSLDEDDLVVQLAESIALQKLVGGSEER